MTASRLVAAKLGADLIHDNPLTGTRQFWSEGEMYSEQTPSETLSTHPFGMYDPPQFL